MRVTVQGNRVFNQSRDREGAEGRPSRFYCFLIGAALKAAS